MTDFLMPKLGADMTRGRLVEWLKKPGERIARGEVIAVVETDKANVDVESWVAGTLEKILVEPGGDWLPVGTPLAVIAAEAGAEAGAPPAFAAAPAAAAPVTVPRQPPPPDVAPGAPPPRAPLPAAAPAAGGERVPVSPIARKRAGELGVDLASVRGTGPGGRITLEDVERAARERPAAAPAAPAADKRQRMRDAIAAAMARSKREIPHYYLGTTIDMSRALAWLATANAKLPVTERLLAGVLLVKAAALALREVPELNGFWIDGRAQASASIHAGIAISLRGGGLVAPAIHDADKLTLAALSQRLTDLVARARAGSLKSSEMTDPTGTITSLGERGVEAVYGVIYPPQLALVGFGKIVERPWAVDGTVVVRPVVTATLSGDHRATDGHRGALYLDAVARLLQEPEKL
ncbi:MAG: 2-oxo acid dehydrogenase subunit E2 [Burkholderiales bacterium]|nr:2-oxo acid dehydrogenase subunit E2 [Burkholderiales bacterium]